MNYYKNHFGMIVISIIALVLSVVMATAGVIVGGNPFVVTDWIKNIGVAHIVITVTGMLVPPTPIAMALGQKMNLKPESTAQFLLENTVASVIFNTANTCVLGAVNIFGNPAVEALVEAGQAPSVGAVYLQSCLHDWPIMFLISFFLAIPVTKFAIKVASKAVDK